MKINSKKDKLILILSIIIILLSSQVVAEEGIESFSYDSFEKYEVYFFNQEIQALGRNIIEDEVYGLIYEIGRASCRERV